ncbi:MAG: radical SAM protein [Acidobacteriota bacterium]
MKTTELLHGWQRILTGHVPSLSIEITRECPLSCPGCYAYGEDHLGGEVVLRQVSDYRGDQLISGVLELIDRYRPLHLSIVGGEPLVRFRELDQLLPQISARGVYAQLVTSAVRPIPPEWAKIDRLTFVVSIDGLQPEHDKRRQPATYERILKHIRGHQITVHCTITRQMTERPGYLQEFLDFWAARDEVRKVWMSLFTPQMGETSYEILPDSARAQVVRELLKLRELYPKLDMPKGLIEVYADPPSSPDECIFARTTRSITADLKQQITPCQFGGDPDCSQCGCIASAGLAAVARHRLPGGLRVGTIYDVSSRIGQFVSRMRRAN